MAGLRKDGQKCNRRNRNKISIAFKTHISHTKDGLLNRLSDVGNWKLDFYIFYWILYRPFVGKAVTPPRGKFKIRQKKPRGSFLVQVGHFA